MAGRESELFYILSSVHKVNMGYLAEAFDKYDKLTKLFVDAEMPTRYRGLLEEGKTVVLENVGTGGRGVMGHKFLHKGTKVSPGRFSLPNVTPKLLRSYYNPDVIDVASVQQLDKGVRLSVQVTLEQIFPVKESETWKIRDVIGQQGGHRIRIKLWDTSSNLVTEEMRGHTVKLVNLETDVCKDQFQLGSVKKTTLGDVEQDRSEIKIYHIDYEDRDTEGNVVGMDHEDRHISNMASFINEGRDLFRTHDLSSVLPKQIALVRPGDGNYRASWITTNQAQQQVPSRQDDVHGYEHVNLINASIDHMVMMQATGGLPGVHEHNLLGMDTLVEDSTAEETLEYVTEENINEESMANTSAVQIPESSETIQGGSSRFQQPSLDAGVGSSTIQDTTESEGSQKASTN